MVVVRVERKYCKSDSKTLGKTGPDEISTWERPRDVVENEGPRAIFPSRTFFFFSIPTLDIPLNENDFTS